MEKVRVKIEAACNDCNGEGCVWHHTEEGPAVEGITCSGCDGEGYQELYVNLTQLKNLLNGGSL